MLLALLLLVAVTVEGKSLPRNDWHIIPKNTSSYYGLTRFNEAVKMTPTSALRIRGYWPGERFQMDFLDDNDNNIVVSVRPEARVEDVRRIIIFNSEICGTYDIEEKRAIPFKNDEEFTMEVRVEELRLVFIINDHWVKTYDHRFNPANIKTLLIKGGVTVKSVEQKEAQEDLGFVDKMEKMAYNVWNGDGQANI